MFAKIRHRDKKKEIVCCQTTVEHRGERNAQEQICFYVPGMWL
jgi:hypothetical protein